MPDFVQQINQAQEDYDDYCQCSQEAQLATTEKHQQSKIAPSIDSRTKNNGSVVSSMDKHPTDSLR